MWLKAKAMYLALSFSCSSSNGWRPDDSARFDRCFRCEWLRVARPAPRVLTVRTEEDRWGEFEGRQRDGFDRSALRTGDSGNRRVV